MSLELSDAQRQAVQRGEPVRLTADDLGDVVVLQAQAYEELVRADADKVAWAKVARKAADRWAEENPFQ